MSRDQARPYNFALSPVLVNLSGKEITLLGPFEKDSSRWERMAYINIHDGSTHTLTPPTMLALPHTFEMIFAQYHRHPEFKSLGPNGEQCNADTHGLLKRYPIRASEIRLIGKETERGWEQAEDVSTLLPSLVHYVDAGAALSAKLQERLADIPLDDLEAATGLSRRQYLHLGLFNNVVRCRT